MTDTPPRPTDAELAILRVLWSRGPSTVRDVHENLARVHETGYTTTLKLLQIMAQKGLVTRDESRRSHVYTTTVTEDETQRQIVGDVLERAFGGSARQLVMQALSTKRASPEELAEIRALLDELDGGGGDERGAADV
ncbi:MAG TPA: BlaI/MecI/CopY family transcriptional regulator [Armatimonadota bacterium]|nr:BlaI/MecI/CopY family transcriptional regulator [Armatimonadota bacterium]